jgi:RHS repeat-associated protein
MYNCELDIGSGEVLHQVTDVFLPCAVPVEITRRYTSSAGSAAGVFGWGWLDNIVHALTINPSSLVRLDALDGDSPTDLAECDGRVGPAVAFFANVAAVPKDFAPLGPDAIRRHLGRPIGSEVLALRYPGGHLEIYLPPLFGDTRWRLLAATDPYGNSATYRYSERFLVAVRSCDAREVRLEYEHDRVRQISVHDVTSGGQSLSWVRFEYDGAGNLASTIDAAGVAYRFDYVDHLLVRFRGPHGLTKYFAYDTGRRCVATWLEGGMQLRRLERDAQRRQVLVTDSYGRRTLLKFDEQRSLVEHVNVVGDTSSRILDGTGSILATVAPDGSVESTLRYDAETRTLLDFGEGEAPWRRRLDALGRLEQVESPAGTIQRFEYDERGELAKIEFANGARVTYSYDERGEAAGFRDPAGYQIWRDVAPDGRTVRFRDEAGPLFLQTFDAMDNLVSEVDEGGRQTRYRYRAPDVVSEEIGPSGEITSYDYDDAMNLRTRTNPLGRTWQIESNAIRQVMAEIDPLGGRVAYEYDAEGNLVAVVNQLGERMEIFRDDLYREVGVRHFDGHVVAYELDALDRRTAIVDARGRRTEYEYSASDNLSRRRFADGAVEEYERNVEGEYSSLVAIPPPGSSERPRHVTYEHTPLGNIAKEQSDEFELEYEWDAGAHVVAIRDSVGGETNYVLGTRYRVREISEGGRTITLRHLLGGEIAEITFPNGLRHVFDYDGSGRMAARTTYSAAGVVLTWRRWSYDADDQLVAMEDWRWGRHRYEYDAAGRLLRVIGPDDQVAEEYAYDATGNLVATPLGGASTFAAGDRLVTAANQSFEHDADGNLVGRRENDQQWRYVWDRDDQLQAVSRDGQEVARFEYDLTNRRRKKHTAEGTRLFLYETYALRAEVLPNGKVRHYVSVPDLAVPIARWGEEGWFYFSYDHLGTPYEVFDDSGNLVATYHTHAYGGARQADGPGAASFELPFGFMGQYRDVETGLHYNHLRYYDPRHGRFISQDPMGLAMGTNFYVYPANPNNNVDLAGFGPVFHCLKSWTPCQKAYARQKINAVNAAPASRRKKTCTKCRANAQRRDFRSKRCGKNKIGRGRQIDHMHELQAGGPDRCCKNLRAIPKKFNNQLGKQVKKMLKDVGKGKTIMKITKVGCNSDEPCKPEDMAKLAQAPKTQEAQCTEPPLDENC